MARFAKYQTPARSFRLRSRVGLGHLAFLRALALPVPAFGAFTTTETPMLPSLDNLKRLKFHLGQTTATPGAIEALQEEGMNPWALLTRHATGDWGDLDDHDKQANEKAIAEGNRIFSAYVLPNTQEKLWVITEADRSSTTILLPDEY